RHVGRDAVLQVDTGVPEVVRPAPERIVKARARGSRDLRVLRATADVWKNLQAFPLDNALDADEVTEAGHSATLATRSERPDCILAVPADLALDLKTPRLLVFVAVAQLAEGDSHLDEPPFGRDRAIDVPDGIPRRIPETAPTARAATAAAVGHDL